MNIRSKIIRKIKNENNNLRLDKFITLALYDKNSYYSIRNPIGINGDFITSPEVSQLFGEIADIRLQSLAEVVEFYNRGGPGHKLQDKRIQPLKLTNEEKTDLIQFLESLTSKNVSCLIAEARQSEPDNHESVAER